MKIWSIIISFVFTVCVFAYNKPHDAIPMGDRRATSSSYKLWGTVGLPVKKAESSNYTLWGGLVLPIGVEEPMVRTPMKFYLSQSYPNPVIFTTCIEYGIPKATNTIIKIYDIAGRAIRTLVSGRQAPGVYKVRWDLTDDDGNHVPPGVYFYHMKADDFVSVKKLTVLK